MFCLLFDLCWFCLFGFEMDWLMLFVCLNFVGYRSVWLVVLLFTSELLLGCLFD